MVTMSLAESYLIPMKWCIAEATVLCLLCAALGGPVMGQRKKHFSKEWLDAEFKEISVKETGAEPAKSGYPDCGNGRFSKKLSLGQWLEFNNTMRTHLNFVEVLPVFTFLIIAAGFFNPAGTQIAGLVLIAARIVYFFSYRIHPNLRGLGVWPGFGAAGYMIWTIVQGLLKA